MRSIKKYSHLISHTADWPKYVFDKFLKRPEIQLRINKKVKAIVPRNQIRAIFKEIFMDDLYNYRFLNEILPENPVIMDIGANVGYFNVLIFSYYPNAKVYSFEPSPNNFSLIHRHKELNNLARLEIYQKAVSDRSGTIDFYFDDSKEYSALGPIYDTFDKVNQKMIEVESDTLVLETHDGTEESKNQDNLLSFFKELGYSTRTRGEMVWAYS